MFFRLSTWRKKIIYSLLHTSKNTLYSKSKLIKKQYNSLLIPIHIKLLEKNQPIITAFGILL